jgi:hypothetical protein
MFNCVQRIYVARSGGVSDFGYNMFKHFNVQNNYLKVPNYTLIERNEKPNFTEQHGHLK